MYSINKNKNKTRYNTGLWELEKEKAVGPYLLDEIANFRIRNYALKLVQKL